jgi:hypothetical protein
MMKPSLAALALTIAMPTLAAAQVPLCTNRSEIVKLLTESLHELPVAAGLAESGRVIEVYANAERSSWTMIVTSPTGTACVVAAGEHWEDLIRTTTPGKPT